MPLHERLRSLMESRRLNLLTEDEYLHSKQMILKDAASPSPDGRIMEVSATAGEPPQQQQQQQQQQAQRIQGKRDAAPKSSAREASFSTCDAEEDVFPLPYQGKGGALARAELDRQYFYNTHMWEVFKAHPNRPVQEREAEVQRRWALKVEVASLRAGVNRFAKETARRRSGALEELLGLAERIEDLRREVQVEHDQALMTVVAAVPAQLVGPADLHATLEKKAHLFRFLRTAETATLDTALIELLRDALSLLTYLQRKARGYCDAGVEAPCSPQREGAQQRVGIDVSLHSSPPPSLTLSAWRKFAKAASKEFHESELRLVSEDTLHTLLRHFGKALTQTERHWVFAHWRHHHKGKAKGSGVATPRRKPGTPRAAGQGKPAGDAAAATLPHAPADALHQQRLLEQLVLIREGEAQRDTRRSVEQQLRREYEDVVRSTLEENVRITLECRDTEARVAASLVHEVERNCQQAFDVQRAELTAKINELITSNAALKHDLQTRESEFNTRLDGMASTLRHEAKREMNAAFDQEFSEVREMRRTYEEQLRLMRSKVALCNEQSERLSTELDSKFSTHSIDDFKRRLRDDVALEHKAEVESLRAELRYKQDLITSLTAQVAAEQRRTQFAAEAEDLFRECVSEMKQASALSSERDHLHAKLSSTFHRVQALGGAPARSHLPPSVLEARLTSPPPLKGTQQQTSAASETVPISEPDRNTAKEKDSCSDKEEGRERGHVATPIDDASLQTAEEGVALSLDRSMEDCGTEAGSHAASRPAQGEADEGVGLTSPAL